MVLLRLSSIPSSARWAVSDSWPMATNILSAASTFSEPALNCGANFFSALKTEVQRIASTPARRPPSTTKRRGPSEFSMTTPSDRASWISSWEAGISPRVLQAHHAHPGGAQAAGRARHVDGHVAAADDQHVLAGQVDLHPAVDHGQQLDAAGDVRVVLVLDPAASWATARPPRRTRRQSPARAACAATRRARWRGSRPQGGHVADVAVDHVLGQAVDGQAGAQHAARLGVRPRRW